MLPPSVLDSTTRSESPARSSFSEAGAYVQHISQNAPFKFNGILSAGPSI